MNMTAVQALIVGAVGTAVFFLFVGVFFRLRFVEIKNNIQQGALSIASAEEREALLKAEIEALKLELQASQTQIAVLNTRLEQAAVIRQKLQDAEIELSCEKDKSHQQNLALEKNQLTAEKDLRAAEEKIQLLQQAEERLRKDFENLANRIFEEKTSRFVTQNQESVNQLLNPLREQIGDFKKKVEDVYDKESRERVSLLAEISQLKNLNLKMSEDAVNLTNALKGDSKVQGNWGEVVLERVLEESGLSRGREYDTQVTLKKQGGDRYIPDVIIRLPENRQIIIDAKVSLLDYERYCSLEDEAQRDSFAKQHVASLRKHIKHLSDKDYSSLEGITTLDFVFIFVPIEAAFMLAVEKEPQLFRDAFEKNIIIVSPTTLLATLRTVESIWRYEAQNKNAEEIARQAGAIHDQLVLMIEALDDVGAYLTKAQNAHAKAVNRMSLGRGNLISKVERLEKLGAKTKKKIPDQYLSSPDNNDEQEDALLLNSNDD